MILAVVKADQAEREAEIAAKRQKDAERQRRHRMSRDVTVTPRDKRDPLPPSEELFPSSLPTESNQPPTHPPIVPHPSDECEIALQAYNAVASEIGLPIAKALTPDRCKHLRRRLAEHGIGGWLAAMDGLRAPFCSGENDRGWKANLDFCLQAKSCAKLAENAYVTSDSPRRPSTEYQPMSFAMMDAVNEEIGYRMAREALNGDRNGNTGRDQGIVLALPSPETRAQGSR
jgi:hypothetical protein